SRQAPPRGLGASSTASSSRARRLAWRAQSLGQQSQSGRSSGSCLPRRAPGPDSAAAAPATREVALARLPFLRSGPRPSMIGKIRKGRSFYWLLRYLTQNPNAAPLDSSVSGSSREVAAHLAAVANAGRALEKPVRHLMVRLPADESLSADEWRY